jgi:hypothetical protein
MKTLVMAKKARNATIEFSLSLVLLILLALSVQSENAGEST